jgi:hypothetical protein
VKLKLPKKIAKLGIAQLSPSSIMICGGIFGNEDNEYSYLDECHKLNLKTMKFSILPHMKDKHILYPNMPKVGGKIYAIGGQFSGHCECFNLATQTWEEMPSYASLLLENDLQTFSLITI